LAITYTQEYIAMKEIARTNQNPNK